MYMCESIFIFSARDLFCISNTRTCALNTFWNILRNYHFDIVFCTFSQFILGRILLDVRFFIILSSVPESLSYIFHFIISLCSILIIGSRFRSRMVSLTISSLLFKQSIINLVALFFILEFVLVFSQTNLKNNSSCVSFSCILILCLW